jgi:AcrR family transcriptional regulator
VAADRAAKISRSYMSKDRSEVVVVIWDPLACTNLRREHTRILGVSPSWGHLPFGSILTYTPLVIVAPVAFQDEQELPTGLRSLKKVKTRLAIEDAALDLFEERGFEATTVEQIAERAEVSTTTFFRYYPTKAEIVLNDYTHQLPALRQAIVERPEAESDLTAVRCAVESAWVGAIDTERTAAKARAVASSPVLRGMGFERGLGWQDAVCHALAERRGLREPDSECAVAAVTALGVLGVAVDRWIAGSCEGDLNDEIDRCFDVMMALCATWVDR